MTGNTGSNTADTAESLYKLIKISGSIQNLLLGQVNICLKLKQEFFQALGENKTLEYIDFDMNVDLSNLLV